MSGKCWVPVHRKSTVSTWSGSWRRTGIKSWYEHGLGVQHYDVGTNGAMPGFDQYLSAIGLILLANGPQTGLTAISNPRTGTFMSKVKSGEGEYMRPPDDYANLKRLYTTQIPTTLTHGSGTNCTEIFIGDFSRVLVGVRTSLKLEVSRQGGDESSNAFSALQVFVRGYMRCDVVFSEPTHFVYIDGILNQ